MSQTILKSLPSCIYQTRTGTLYHVSPPNQLNFTLQYLGISISDFQHMSKLLSELPMDFKTFIGFSEKTLVLQPIDCIKQCIRGSNKPDSIQLTSKSGFREFSISDYNNFAKKISPSILISLTESPDSSIAGKKSLERCLYKTLFFLDQTIENLYNEKNIMDNTLLFASIQGGHSIEMRIKAIQTSLKRKEVSGIMIYGLCEGEDYVENHIERGKLIDIMRDHIPIDRKITIGLHSIGEPIDILHGLIHNIDLFDTDYPFYLAENGSAFIYSPLQFPKDFEILEKIEEDVINDEYFNNKFAKIIDFNNDIFKNDLGPLVENCLCECCKNYSRAYILHLLKTKEMTGNVLLVLHNLYCFENFWENIRKTKELKIFNKFVLWFLKNHSEENFAKEKKNKKKKEENNLFKEKNNKKKEDLDEKNEF